MTYETVTYETVTYERLEDDAVRINGYLWNGMTLDMDTLLLSIKNVKGPRANCYLTQRAFNRQLIVREGALAFLRSGEKDRTYTFNVDKGEMT